jgi:hypothetical protein
VNSFLTTMFIKERLFWIIGTSRQPRMRAEQQIESCEGCHPDDAEIPFDWLLAVLSVEFRVLSEDGNRFYSKLTTHDSKPQRALGRIFTARISSAQLLVN